MAAPMMVPEERGELDEVVTEVCRTLQISDSQFELAQEHYRTVGDWLSREGSPLAQMEPRIYPQGSMALRTTVRPRDREEFDLDFVLEVVPSDSDPMLLYKSVADRLEAHATYRKMLEPMRRCLRLNYEHQFHLDILPARRDGERGTSCIEVPDTKLETWKPSNPLGYVGWFERRCDQPSLLKAKREQFPLPVPLPESQLKVLRQAVQLIKRRRDNEFRGAEHAPRSVILTTLAGKFYSGTDSISAALEQVLLAIEHALNGAAPGVFEVRNPTNPDELFSESWADPTTYQAFVGFIREFRREVSALRLAEGLVSIADALDRMFGNELGKSALRGYGDTLAKAKAAGKLRFGAPGIITLKDEGRVVPPNTFHHRES
jgi:hypothetical protein